MRSKKSKYNAFEKCGTKGCDNLFLIKKKGLRKYCKKCSYERLRENIRKNEKKYKEAKKKLEEITANKIKKRGGTRRSLKSKSSYIDCKQCGKSTYKNGYNQKYCLECRPRRGISRRFCK